MDERNTYPCSGCGKPFLSEGSRNQHEGNCPLVETEDQEPVDDQDQHRETPPDPEPEIPSPPKRDLDPQPDRKAVDFGSGCCQCCGSEVGTTTRKGLCYGCDLAGCSTDTPGCKHRKGGSSSA